MVVGHDTILENPQKSTDVNTIGLPNEGSVEEFALGAEDAQHLKRKAFCKPPDFCERRNGIWI